MGVGETGGKETRVKAMGVREMGGKAKGTKVSGALSQGSGMLSQVLSQRPGML